MTYINSMPDNDIRKVIRAIVFPDQTDEQLAFCETWFNARTKSHDLFEKVKHLFPVKLVNEICFTTPESRIDFIKATSYDLEEVEKYNQQYPVRAECYPEDDKVDPENGFVYKTPTFINAKTNEVLGKHGELNLV